MLGETGQLLQNKSDELSELDSRFGDGDHGVTIKKIAVVIEEHTRQWQNAFAKPFLTELSNAVMGVSGGAAAPLWGTFLGGLALPLEDGTTEIGPSLLKLMFSSALKEMQDITNARIGDKTLMDALIPAVESAESAPDALEDILQAAAEAAEKGAAGTADFIARFGRAKNYRERTLGTPDPGAVSLSLFFKGLAAGFKTN